MSKSGGIEVEGVNSLIRALLTLTPATQQAADRGLSDWAVDEEGRVKAAARRVDAQARLAARSVRAQQGKGGRITAGGRQRLGNGTAGDLFFGAEFGGGARPSTRQFRPYRQRGYWFFPTIEADEDTTMIDAASKGLDAAERAWGR